MDQPTSASTAARPMAPALLGTPACKNILKATDGYSCSSTSRKSLQKNPPNVHDMWGIVGIALVCFRYSNLMPRLRPPFFLATAFGVTVCFGQPAAPTFDLSIRLLRICEFDRCQ